VTRLRAGRSRFYSRRGLGIFHSATASRPVLGPTQLHTQGVPWVLSLGIKRPGREADHSHQSSAAVMNTWNYTSAPSFAFMAWCLVKYGDNFTLPYDPSVWPTNKAARSFVCRKSILRTWSLSWSHFDAPTSVTLTDISGTKPAMSSSAPMLSRILRPAQHKSELT
jgi:hypothetical protein